MRACLVVSAVLVGLTAAASAEHACDALGQHGWRTLATVETMEQSDSAPYQIGASWFVDRTTTVLPFCNYYNSLGNYSMRSYSLSPETRTERVEICRSSAQGSTPVAPYAGHCPPS
ncbi:MAG: hypothetical protein IT537_14945 [Hyphomicrobiales bacterium]|nr:hypothetical protein [Hyphomicrobiales bacterium]